MKDILSEISLITILTIVTFIVAIVFFRKSKLYYSVLLLIMISVFTELISLYSLVNKFPVVLYYNIFFILNQTLWIGIIVSVLKKFLEEFLLIILFLFFSILNIIFFEHEGLTYLTFILGSLIYLLYFIVKHFNFLRKEKLEYFSSSKFLLLSAPISFFFAFSFVFAFRESDMKDINLMNHDLYTILSTIGNFIYYSLLILYIIKSRKEKPVND